MLLVALAQDTLQLLIEGDIFPLEFGLILLKFFLVLIVCVHS